MHAPRPLSSLQVIAIGLFACSQVVCGQTVTPAPSADLITVPPNKTVTDSVVVTSTPGTEADVTGINAKLDSIVIPEVKLENASLEDAVAQIRTVVAKLDTTAASDKQVSILVDLTPKAQKRVDSKVHLTMDLRAESLRNILGVIAKEAGLEVGVKPTGVTLSGAR